MAFSPHTRVSFGGKMTSLHGTDVWNCNVNVLSTDDNGPLADPGAYQADIAPALLAWYTSSANNMHSDCSLDFVKVNNIGPDGRYASSTESNRFDFPASSLGSGGRAHPAFLSLVFTWDTGVARGAAKRGRIYPPNGTYVVQQGVEVSAASQTAAMQTAKDLLQLLQNGSNEGRGAHTIIASTIGGVTRQITGVSVDSIYDYQGRRKNAVSGVRTALAVQP